MTLYSSGVDAYVVDRTVECAECAATQDVELVIDRESRDDPRWDCAVCGHTNSYVEPEPDDDQLLAYWRI